MAETNGNIIKFEKTRFAYYNGVPVLEDVNLEINANSSACIVGPNGGGKTTLLKLILGLLKPSSGTIKVFGAAPEKARAKIGYVPQYTAFDPMFPVSVMDVALMGRMEKHRFGFYSKTDRKKVVETLEEIGAENLKDRSFSELSGGQRQRILIARALVSDPGLLLLDEPTANIDPAVEEQIFDILRKLERKLTILTVTHDLGFVSSIFQTVICVNRRIVIHPTSQMTGERIQEIYGRKIRMIHHDHDCGGHNV